MGTMMKHWIRPDSLTIHRKPLNSMAEAHSSGYTLNPTYDTALTQALGQANGTHVFKPRIKHHIHERSACRG